MKFILFDTIPGTNLFNQLNYFFESKISLNMKSFLYSSLLLAGIFAISSCGGPSGKLNEESMTGGNASPSGSDAPNVAINMTPEHIAAGKATYLETCAPCHGAGGKGDGPAAAALNPKPRDHTNGAYMDKLTNGHLFTVIKQGGSSFGYPGMPAQAQLADDTIKNVIAFVRTLSNTYHPQQASIK